jgi:2-methylcitrate dehydratase PrpD
MAVAPNSPEVDGVWAYELAFADWLACASAGAGERASKAMRGLGDDLVSEVAFVATAGHVLDFDDTFADGVAHVSATTAPAALVLAAHLDLPVRAAVAAYAEGFEAMAAVAAASHPALYDGGWHPTAVCGPVGAAVSASRLLGLNAEQRANALGVALLRAGGTRAAFGSDGKAIQVGLACAAGVQGALLARVGATVDPRVISGPLGFEAVTAAGAPLPGAPLLNQGESAARAAQRAIERNWIKPYPSCLGTHSPIQAAVQARAEGRRPDGDELIVFVHPVARQAAHLDDVDAGLAAKFSIPYCVAFTLVHGPPGVRDFAAVDPFVRAAGRRVTVKTDPSLPQFGAVLTDGERELARVEHPPGSPERPMTPLMHRRKTADLAGDRLDSVLADHSLSARAVLSIAGLSRT